MTLGQEIGLMMAVVAVIACAVELWWSGRK
jgi:hypothetical protein